MPPSGTTVVRDRPNQRWTQAEEAALRRGIAKCALCLADFSCNKDCCCLRPLHCLWCLYASNTAADLLAGHHRHGVGKWQQIITDPDFMIGPVLAARSNVDLKVCSSLACNGCPHLEHESSRAPYPDQPENYAVLMHVQDKWRNMREKPPKPVATKRRRQPSEHVLDILAFMHQSVHFANG